MRKVVDIRKDAMLTQKEFSKALGVSVACIQRWEQNKNEPSLRYKRKIVDFCKTNNIEYSEVDNEEIQ